MEDLMLDGVSDEGASSPSRLGLGNVRRALQRWWVMLLFGILGYVGSLYYLSVQKGSSVATTLVEESTRDAVLVGSEFETEVADSGITIGNIIRKFQAPTMLRAVADHPRVLDLKNFMPPKISFKPRNMRTEQEDSYQSASSVESSKRQDMILGMVTISKSNNSSILEVSAKHADPGTAKTVADVVAEVLLESEEAKLMDSSNSGFNLLKNEAGEVLIKVEALEASSQEYNSALQLNGQIQTKRDEIIAIRQRYKPQHPKYIHQMAMFTDLLKRFEREISRVSDTPSEAPYWLKYREEIAAADELMRADSQAGLDARDEWLSLIQNALTTRSNLLLTSKTSQSSLHSSLIKRMEEIDLNDEENINDFTIVEKAHITSSVADQRLVVLAAGSAIGILLGFGLAYLLAVIDYKIYDVRSAEEATGLTCMAAIPASSKFSQGKEWRPVLKYDTVSANAEAIRNLRASVVLLGPRERNKVILVTSAIPGEGKTTMSSELAAAFALNNERTLLVDMDMRRPKLTKSFPHLKGAPGVVELLAEQAKLEDTFHETELPLLTVMGSGNRAPNPSELLSEGNFMKVLDNLRPDFDRIIFDSAPVLPVADSRLLAKYADAVLLVVRSRKTPIGAMMRARELLNAAGARFGGVIVNGMKNAGTGRYYGYKGLGEYGATDYKYHEDE